MNILLQSGLPEEYEGVPISADFRNMIQADLILRDAQASETEKTLAALHQLYPEIPRDLRKAVAGLQWFYGRGAAPAQGAAAPAPKAAKQAFSFEQDANLIYTAFYAAYGLSLTTVEFLHWWEFMALFEGLPEDTLLRRVMYWRTAELSALPKAEKKHVLNMRALFALEGAQPQAKSVQELNQNSLARVQRRFEEAQRALKQSAESADC